MRESVGGLAWKKMRILGERALAGGGRSCRELTRGECGHLWSRPTHRPRSLVQAEPPHLPVLLPHGIPRTGWLEQNVVLTALEAGRLKVLAGWVLARVSALRVASSHWVLMPMHREVFSVLSDGVHTCYPM